MARILSVAAIVAAASASAQEGTTDADGLAAGPDRFASSEEAWDKTCARCHTTGVGPELLGRELAADYVTFIVREGYIAMPAFPHSHLDDETLNGIAEMIEASEPRPGAETEEN